MSRLFNEPAIAQAPSIANRIVGVAVNANVWGTFDYVWPESFGEPQRGQRVRVPFGRGNRKTLGFVVDTLRRAGERKLKAITEVVDEISQLNDHTWELAEWISHYYMSPLGPTLAAAVPAAVGTRAPKQETVVFLAAERCDWPGDLGSKQRRVLDELLEARKQGVEPVRMEELRHHSQAARDTFRRLLSRELIRAEQREVTLDRLAEEDDCVAAAFELNAEQQAALEAIRPRLDGEAGFSATLLHGVTGSGKTEVYVRAIREVIAAGGQAILLAPEIALATQTWQRLIDRLPRVAVLHSGLTGAQRAFYWQQIRDGHASVVIGPRSAVFAPAGKLGLVIVDEEHESSYKQDTVPRYHGRDVAVKRASLAGVPIILGSATPSMESLHNARHGRYELVRLPNRVRGLAMPRLQIVHLRDDMARGRVELIGRTLTARMAAALDRGEQMILLMNRRGYASYVFCPKCDWMLECDQCIRPMVWHQATQLCICHHCNATASLPDRCPACGGKLLLFGYGIQRVENELARKFPTGRVARMDSDTMTSPKQFQKVLGEFGSGQIDILLGTQMVAKGLDFPKVSLVGIASADTSLSIHDFRASERTFQLIVQVAGRAGRSDAPGEVVVQTLHPGEAAIELARNHDYKTFSDMELQDRKSAGFPPFNRMVRFILTHARHGEAEASAVRLGEILRECLPTPETTIIGPQPAMLPRLRDEFRFDILLLTQQAGLVQQRLGGRMKSIAAEIKADLAVDVDPVNLL
ncbi:MAG: primosomal protein N' [Planctomycetes bacterium]|nr:primosomal protein N' [Planctomycetota bacterium]